MKNIFIKTLGCKVNSFDTHAIQSQLIASGFNLVESAKDADISVINSCSVTSNAEKEARYLLRRYRRDNPKIFQVVTGCYAQTDSARLASLDEVNFVIPNEVKSDFVSLLEQKLGSTTLEKLPEQVRTVKENRQGHFKSSLTLFAKPESTQTRAFVKIQDGCNGFCSYCLIPYARGASRSVPKENVLKEISALASEGTSEIVFTGIHLGDYGEDLSDSINLCQLLQQTTEIAGIKRIRLSSLEPMEVNEDLLQLMAERQDIFCHHLHLPLQSGSDRILKLMRRKYGTQEYKDTILMIRDYLPNVHLTADVIPGFPGESEDDFSATMTFIEDSGLHGLHVFPYSKRPNTAASRMPNHLEQNMVNGRATKLRELSSSLSQNFYQKFLGERVEVLWEKDHDADGHLLGKTKNYLNVAGINSNQLPGSISQVVLKGFLRPQLLLGV